MISKEYELGINKNHFFEINTDSGYVVDYKKVELCNEDTFIRFLTDVNMVSEKLFYPLYIYIIRNHDKMDKNNLSYAVERLYEIMIDYDYEDKAELRYKIAKCDACKEFISNYIEDKQLTMTR